ARVSRPEPRLDEAEERTQPYGRNRNPRRRRRGEVVHQLRAPEGLYARVSDRLPDHHAGDQAGRSREAAGRSVRADDDQTGECLAHRSKRSGWDLRRVLGRYESYPEGTPGSLGEETGEPDQGRWRCSERDRREH